MADRKLRICFLAAADSFHSHRWIQFFVDQGHEVHWLSLTPPSKAPHPSIHFQQIGGGTSRQLATLRALFSIRRAVFNIQPDVLHAHYAGLYGLLGAVSGFKPYILTAWGSDIVFAAHRMVHGTLIRYALRCADLITCDAEHMVQRMVALGVEREKIQRIHFGVETDRFVPGPRDHEILARWNAIENPVIISLRNLESVYDVETLIRAVPDVLKRHPTARFILAGTGSLRDELIATINRLEVESAVTLIGRYDNTELPRMLNSATVYVSTALSDAGISASTAEAMSAGVPVVVSNSGENDQWITPGVTGFLFPVQDATELATRLCDLLDNQENARRIGLASREVILEKNCYATEMRKMEQLYFQWSSRRGS